MSEQTVAGSVTIGFAEFLAMLGISERAYYYRRAKGLMLPPLAYSARSAPRWSRDDVGRWLAAGAPPADQWRQQKTQA